MPGANGQKPSGARCSFCNENQRMTNWRSLATCLWGHQRGGRARGCFWQLTPPPADHKLSAAHCGPCARLKRNLHELREQTKGRPRCRLGQQLSESNFRRASEREEPFQWEGNEIQWQHWPLGRKRRPSSRRPQAAPAASTQSTLCLNANKHIDSFRRQRIHLQALERAGSGGRQASQAGLMRNLILFSSSSSPLARRAEQILD